MVEEMIVIGTQAIEATTIALLLDDIEALQEEEPHQGTEVGGALLEAYLAALLAIVAGQEVATASAQLAVLRQLQKNQGHVVQEIAFALKSVCQFLKAEAHLDPDPGRGPVPGLVLLRGPNPGLVLPRILPLQNVRARSSRGLPPRVLMERKGWFRMETAPLIPVGDRK